LNPLVVAAAAKMRPVRVGLADLLVVGLAGQPLRVPLREPYLAAVAALVLALAVRRLTVAAAEGEVGLVA